MLYTAVFFSPLGEICLAADTIGVTELRFVDPAQPVSHCTAQMESVLLCRAIHWLTLYFSGCEPGFSVPVHPAGTPFQQRVWQALSGLGFGQTMTYGQLADCLHIDSPRAVGAALGRNPVLLLLPCHRVLGSDGSLTGYAGGLERKRALLALEGVRTDKI